MTKNHRTSDSARWGIDEEPRSDATAVEAGGGAHASGDDVRTELLGHVRRTETIADRVEFEAIRAELPDGWSVGPDLVQFGSAPLAETIAFERAGAGPKLLLKPVDGADPAGTIEVYERPDPRTARRLTATVDPLSAALRAAINRAHQFEE